MKIVERGKTCGSFTETCTKAKLLRMIDFHDFHSKEWISGRQEQNLKYAHESLNSNANDQCGGGTFRTTMQMMPYKTNPLFR